MRQIFLFVTVILPLACSAVSRNPAPNANIGVSDKLLLKIGLARSFLSSEKRFVSYGLTSGRLSVVAPEGPREVWGHDLPGFHGFFTLPEAAGAALWSSTKLHITEQNAAQSFDINSFTRYIHAARSHPAFTLVHTSGDSFKLIKLLNDRTWQNENFEINWTLESGTLQYELVTSLSPSGQQLLAIDLYGNAFDHHQEDSAGRLEPVLEDCGAFGSLTGTDNFRSLRWSQDESKIYLGTQKGRLHQLTLKDACSGQDAVREITLPNAYAVLDIQEDKDQQLLISQPGLITSIDSKTWTIVASTPTSCQVPMGAVSLDATHLLIACLVPSGTLDSAAVPLALSLQDEIQYIVQEFPQGAERIFKFKDSAIGGLAIDGENKRLYMMSGSRLGRLEIHDLLTGEMETASGLLIDGILDL